MPVDYHLAKARALLDVPAPTPAADTNPEVNAPAKLAITCPCCGGRMALVEVFERGYSRHSQRNRERRDYRLN
jgi:hypothetical protein